MCAKAAVVLLLVCASQASAQTQPFSTKVEAVRVDVLVTENNGRVVRGLQAADFDVRDNGVQQQVDLVSFEQIPLNLVLVFDMSSSVAGERLVHLREGIRGLLAGLKPEDQAALITFDRAVYRHSGLTTELERVRTALVTADGKGDTALIDAVYTGMMIGESDVGRSLVMVFSDGLDTASILSSEMVLDTAKRSDVVVFGVVAGGSKKSFVRDLCDATGGSFHDAGSTRNLGATFLSILNEFRQRYLISYSPHGVVAEGWHRLDVRVKGRRADVKARPGYSAK